MTDVWLVGIDGSEGGRKAADFAAGRAKTVGATLIVVYVIEWSPYTFNTPEENEERHQRREEEIDRARTRFLEPLVAEFSGRGLAVEGIVQHGHAAEVMSELAGQRGASQIFIGRTGGTKIAGLVFGSIAAALVQVSPVPVTVVP